MRCAHRGDTGHNEDVFTQRRSTQIFRRGGGITQYWAEGAGHSGRDELEELMRHACSTHHMLPRSQCQRAPVKKTRFKVANERRKKSRTERGYFIA